MRPHSSYPKSYSNRPVRAGRLYVMCSGLLIKQRHYSISSTPLGVRRVLSSVLSSVLTLPRGLLASNNSHPITIFCPFHLRLCRSLSKKETAVYTFPSTRLWSILAHAETSGSVNVIRVPFPGTLSAHTLPR